MPKGIGMDDHPGYRSDLTSALFDGLKIPVCLVDADGRLVAMNRSALSFWSTDGAGLMARPAAEALGIVPADGGGDVWSRLSPPGARPRLTCRISAPDGEPRAVSIIYAALAATATTPPLGALFVVEGARGEVLSDVPEWALRDPVTGLGNRHKWEREAGAWATRSGCVVFFDLDDLKEVNDLHGHAAGDRLLAAAGHSLAAVAPSDALIVRYGGDEFVSLLPDPDETAAEEWAQRAVRNVAAAAAPADLPLVPRLSHGVAAFGPGGLRDAIHRADDVLYERKDVLLPAASGGRVILTRAGRAALRGPGDDRARPQPGAFSAGFGPEFDGYFRVQYARALEQAQEFVAFVDPQPGTAVVEVGAGSGRITFDGGLAERIGRQGQLLITDPSGAQLLGCRKHAEERGFDWVRFIRAPVEALPLASGTADLVVGALFLHFTDPAQALREMVRVVRPGGRVAISAGLEHSWPPVWEDAIEPIRQALEAEGVPLRHHFLRSGELEHLMAAAGLRMERSRVVGPLTLEFPSADLAVGLWRQVGLVRLLLRGHGGERVAQVEEEFERRIRENFLRHPSAEWSITDGRLVSVVSQRPG